MVVFLLFLWSVSVRMGDVSPLQCEIPQGSDLSHLLSNIYMKLVGKIICQYVVQIIPSYTHLHPSQATDAITMLTGCLEDIESGWGETNFNSIF